MKQWFLGSFILLSCVIAGCRAEPRDPIQVLTGYLVCNSYGDPAMYFVPTKEAICTNPTSSLTTSNFKTGFQFKLNDRVAHDVYLLGGDTIRSISTRSASRNRIRKVIVAPVRLILESNPPDMERPPLGLPDQGTFVIAYGQDSIVFTYRYPAVDVLKVGKLECN